MAPGRGGDRRRGRRDRHHPSQQLEDVDVCCLDGDGGDDDDDGDGDGDEHGGHDRDHRGRAAPDDPHDEHRQPPGPDRAPRRDRETRAFCNDRDERFFPHHDDGDRDGFELGPASWYALASGRSSQMTKRQTGFLAVALTICSGTVWAQGAQDTSSPEYLEAKQRLQEGKTLYGQHNLEGARLKFEQACAVLKTPACLRALGLSQFYTGRYIEALQNLQKSLDDKELDTASRKEVTDLVQQAFDKTGHIEIKAPGGGRVTIDDTTDAGNAPLASAIHVTVGSHSVTVTFGDKTERMQVECPAGKVAQANFEPKFPGTSQGGDQNPPPGQAEMHRSTAGYVVPVVLGVIGLGGLGLGIGAGAMSFSAASDANALRTPGVCANQASSACQAYSSKLDSQNTLSTISTIGYVAGGVFLAASVIAFVAWPKVAKEKVAFVPWVGSSGGGFGVLGKF